MNAEKTYYDAYMAALSGLSTFTHPSASDRNVVDAARRTAMRTVEQFAKDGLVPETDAEELLRGFEK